MEDDLSPGPGTGRRASEPDCSIVDPEPFPPWLREHKVEIPDPVPGYVHRAELEQRCSPTGRELTVLQAPGGFGKTALLAACCRRLRDADVPVAWLELGDADDPGALATYLALSFERAGIATFDAVSDVAGPAGERESDTQAQYRANLLIRAIRHVEAPCILALDEVEHLRNPEAVALLNAFLEAAPRQLSIALAFRERPQGLDIATRLLDGRGGTLTVEDLRFSRADIGRFFGSRLTRRELASIADYSAGWPIALTIHRNALGAGTPPSDPVADDAAAAWIDTRLLRGLDDDDRELLLDISLFDWIDPELIDEATGRANSRRRIRTMAPLAGLLQTAGDASAAQLHPLIREHCAERRFRESPDRYCTVHAAIARGLSRRHHVVEALRHAAEAGDPELLADIAANADTIALWIGRGFEALQVMDGYLTADLVTAHPRLTLVRCLVRALSGDMDGARQVYQAAAVGDGLANGDVRPMDRDHFLVLGILTVLGCSPLNHHSRLIETASEFAGQPDLDPMVRGMIRHGLCQSLTDMAEFDRAAAEAEHARADLGHHTQYLSPHLDLQLGLVAMAQGHTEDASDRYQAALALAREAHLGDTGTVMFGEILAAELELERNVNTRPLVSPTVSPRLLGESAAWHDVYAANIGVAAELAIASGAPDRALATVVGARDFARSTERPALATLVSAMRVSVLVIAGRVDEALRAWHGDDLPRRDDACLDFSAYRWREVEAIACARLRLLIAREDFEAARGLARSLDEATESRRLVRTRMRTLALSMRLESLAGCPDRATAHLETYLRLFARADYARPLAREREIAAPLLVHVAEHAAEEAVANAARSLGDALAAPAPPATPAVPTLTARELDVLKRLEHHADGQIARDLDLTYDRVRYQVRKLFAKLGARSRLDAVHRARALGILPGSLL